MGFGGETDIEFRVIGVEHDDVCAVGCSMSIVALFHSTGLAHHADMAQNIVPAVVLSPSFNGVTILALLALLALRLWGLSVLALLAPLALRLERPGLGVRGRDVR